MKNEERSLPTENLDFSNNGTHSEADFGAVPDFVKPKSFFAKFLDDVRMISNPVTLLASFYAFSDRRTPLAAKILLGAALAYFVLPTDTLFDPVYADDIAVLMSTLATFAGNFVTSEHYAKAEAFVAKVFRTFGQ